MVLLNATYLRCCIRLCVVYTGELCPCCLPCLLSSIHLPIPLPFFCQRTCDVCVVPVRHRCPINFQNKIQYMFALPETKQVTFDGSVNAAFDPPVDVWWDDDEQMKMFFSLFLISNTPPVQLLLQTHQTSLVTEARGRLSMGESASHTCLPSNCTQPTFGLDFLQPCCDVGGI